MTTDRTSGPSSPHAPRGLQRRKPSPLALEARIMFDGAAVASAADAAKPVTPGEAAASHVAELAKTVVAAQPNSQGSASAPSEAGKTASDNAQVVHAAPQTERASDGLSSAAGGKVLFVDARVPDYQAIVAAAASDVKVVILDAEHDGMQQIAQALNGMQDLQSITIVSHGDSGLLLLGNSALYADGMDNYTAELASIGAALGSGGEILLYGCDVGAGEKGQSFIQSLADATGAVVAASTDATGGTQKGGNWDLEISTGTLASVPVLNVSMLLDYNHSLYTTSVGNLADLKTALATASTDGADDIITLTANITFLNAADTINLTISDGHKTTIVGGGFKIDGANLTQVLHINSGSGSVELNNLTITNGVASANGGNSQDQQGNAAAIDSNAGGTAQGGGIYNAGFLSIVNSSITNNKAAAGGGGGGHRSDPTGGAGGGGGAIAGLGGTGGTFTSPVTAPGAASGIGSAGTAGMGGRGGAYYDTSLSGGAGGSSAGGVGTASYDYVASGGSGGSVTGGGASIGAGAGGAGINAPGSKGGDAAGGIYNTGTLVIVNSTITGNIAAGGGGGGSAMGAVNFGYDNGGAAGNGGNAYGGIYNGGVLKMDSASYASMNNFAAAGKGGKADGTGNTSGADGVAVGNVAAGSGDFNYVPPTLSVSSTNQPVNDNTTLTPFSAATVTGSGVSVTITVDSTKGAFTAASVTAGGFTSSTSSGITTYSHTATTAAALESAMRALVFQPVANKLAVGSSEAVALAVRISDGVNSASGTANIVSTSVNDAPTGLGTLSVPTILEDAITINGTAISSLTGLAFVDPDFGSSLAGIAVVSNASSGTTGAWQYSTDSGAHWYDIGTASDASAVALSASTLLRFKPVQDYNGSAPVLTVRALDNTYAGTFSVGAGTENRITIPASSNGGTTAIAATTSTISATVTAVNDVPSFTKGANLTVQEDAGSQTVAGWATDLSKGPADESGQTLTFLVTNDNVALFSVQPGIDANGNLTFTAAANASGTATVSVVLKDNGGTANGGVDTSAVQTFVITVNGVNDAPTGLGNLTLPSILEDTTAPAGAAINALNGLAFADVDVGDTLSGIAVTANTADAASQGVWQYSLDGTTWQAVGTVSNSASLLLSAATRLRFVPVADYFGTPTALTVRAIDSSYTGLYTTDTTPATLDTGAANGGSTPVSTATNTIGITVTSVNDAPTFTKGADIQILEDASAQTITGWATGILAGPANESGQTLGFSVTNSNNGLFSVQPTLNASGDLTFTAAPNINGVATVTVRLTDSGGTANGGVDSVVQTFTITITPDNDAPTGVPVVSGQPLEGQVLTSSTTGIGDIDGLSGVTFNHQWQESADGAVWFDISGATSATYTLDSVQVGKQVRDKVTFTDNDGTLETVISTPTATVAGVVPQVVSINRDSAAQVLASATSITYTVTFNVGVTGVDAGDFELTPSGTAVGRVGRVDLVPGSGNTYQVTVDNLSGDGTLRLDLNNSGTGIVSGSSTAIGGGFTSGQSYVLDRTAPAISSVFASNVPQKVGDTMTITLTVGDDGGTPYTLGTGSTIGGYTLGNLVRITSTTYSAQYSVTAGGNDYAASDSIPTNIRLLDPAGNVGTYVTPITLSNDSINGNPPTALALSNASVRVSDGLNALVGTLSTTDASVGETFTYSLVSGLGDTDNSAFSLVGNVLRVNDPAALGNGAYSVRVRVTDSGGNRLEQVYAISVSTYSPPLAAADTASATAAGSAGAGVNPVGNVLNNDLSSNTKAVTTITGGTVGTALAGMYGSLTLNTDGSYTYTVNNNNAAVQALRTNADTLTDTFTYTMADNTAATSSASLTVTIHGANDAPTANGAISLRQVTQGTAWTYSIPTGLITDVDAGDTLTWSATLLGGGALPAWLSFDPATRTFSGTPTTLGDIQVTVTATDLANETASLSFTVRTSAVPVVVPPVVTPPVVTPPVVTPPVVTPPVVTPPVVDPVTPPVVDPVIPPEVVPVTPPVQVADPQVPNTPLPPVTAPVVPTQLSVVDTNARVQIGGSDFNANSLITGTTVAVPNGGSSAVTGFVITGNSGFIPNTGGGFSAGTGSSLLGVGLSSTLTVLNDSPVRQGATPILGSSRGSDLTDSGRGSFQTVVRATEQSGLSVNNGVEDQQLLLGERMNFTIPSDAFAHTDQSASVVLRASLANGQPLPAWMRFDANTGRFEGTAPPGFRGELVIKVQARDNNGREAQTTFRVNSQGRTEAMLPAGRSGLSEQMRSAASRVSAWAVAGSGRS